MAISNEVNEFLERKINSNDILPKIVDDFLKYVVNEENKHYIKKMLIYMFPEKDIFTKGEYYSRSEGYFELQNNIHNEPVFMKELTRYIKLRGMFGE